MKPSAPARYALLFALARDKRGASALEFALISPILIVLILGAMEVGWAMNRASTVQWAIERASRAAMVDSLVTREELEDRVNEILRNMNEPDGVTIRYEVSSLSDAVVGHVSADYAHSFQMPFVPGADMRVTVDSYIPVP
ncbi:MAG: pilus assembly protein [Maricaulaceae bacterium]|jgi:Flp pilus assembly protein TadG